MHRFHDVGELARQLRRIVVAKQTRRRGVGALQAAAPREHRLGKRRKDGLELGVRRLRGDARLHLCSDVGGHHDDRVDDARGVAQRLVDEREEHVAVAHVHAQLITDVRHARRAHPGEQLLDSLPAHLRQRVEQLLAEHLFFRASPQLARARVGNVDDVVGAAHDGDGDGRVGKHHAQLLVHARELLRARDLDGVLQHVRDDAVGVEQRRVRGAPHGVAPRAIDEQAVRDERQRVDDTRGDDALERLHQAARVVVALGRVGKHVGDVATLELRPRARRDREVCAVGRHEAQLPIEDHVRVR